MQGGVKHLVMLNHSRGRGCWEPSGAAREEAGDREDPADRPQGQGGGQEGVWRQGEGVQVGVKLVLVSVETTTIKNGCRSQCCWVPKRNVFITGEDPNVLVSIGETSKAGFCSITSGAGGDIVVQNSPTFLKAALLLSPLLTFMDLKADKNLTVLSEFPVEPNEATEGG